MGPIAKIAYFGTAWRWLAMGLALHVGLALLLAIGCFLAGESWSNSIRNVGSARVALLAKPSSRVADSWRPMLQAHRQFIEHPERNLYDIFLVEHVKFQYPPSSLLIFDLLPQRVLETGVDDADGTLRRLLDTTSWLSVLITALASAALVEVGLRRAAPEQAQSWQQMALRVPLSIALSVTFYPVLRAFELGQIQAWLNALVALGLLFHVLRWNIASGICLGLCTLVKPQYGLALIWALLRRQGYFAGPFVAAFGLGTLAAVARFGLANHFAYVQVLRFISRQGEAFWPNQSVNGVLNRFFENGDPLNFSAHDFAPYHPLIYGATVLTSLALLAVALWPFVGRNFRTLRDDAPPYDLALVLATATFASPVAWEHHYGAFLPMFAVVLPGVLATRPLGRASGVVLLFSYLLMADVLLRADLLFTNRWLGLLASHLFLGAALLLLILWTLRWETRAKDLALDNASA